MHMTKNRQLDKFVIDYQLQKNQKLVKHLIIIGIHAMKQKSAEISNETIKIIAHSYKDNSLTEELKMLRQKVQSLEKHLNPVAKSPTQKNILQNDLKDAKSHSQPKITPKITELKAVPSKHHLDDSEIKSILWNQFNYQSQGAIPEAVPRRSEQPILTGCLPRHGSQEELSSGFTTQRELAVSNTNCRTGTQRSSHSSRQNQSNASQYQTGERTSPQFKEEAKKSKRQKENKAPQQEAQKGIPKNLRKVESKIKDRIEQDRKQHKSQSKKSDAVLPEDLLSSIGDQNPLTTTPQHKYFQPCQSTHFGQNLSPNGGLRLNLESNKQSVSTERKMMNLEEIANSFLNSPFMKSHVKQRLFRQSNVESNSSVSSNFSLFNPNNELKSFFQREYGQKVQNSISFQF